MPYLKLRNWQRRMRFTSSLVEMELTFGGVHYHTVRPYGNNVVEYCRNMSYMMAERFRSLDIPPLTGMHFHDFNAGALHLLQDRNTVFTYHSGMDVMAIIMVTGGNIMRFVERMVCRFNCKTSNYCLGSWE